MSRRVLISGSVAYDTIMVFEGHFKDHILPDRVHMLNAFLAPRLKREYGAARPTCLQPGWARRPSRGARDDRTRRRRLPALCWASTCRRYGDSTSTTPRRRSSRPTCPTTRSSRSTRVRSDARCRQRRRNAGEPAAFGIVAPNGRDAMLQHARIRAGRRALRPTRQGLPMFDGEALRGFIATATAVAVNDYEASLLVERTGWRSRRSPSACRR